MSKAEVGGDEMLDAPQMSSLALLQTACRHRECSYSLCHHDVYMKQLESRPHRLHHRLRPNRPSERGWHFRRSHGAYEDHALHRTE